MNTEEEFQIRLDSYEFVLDECIRYENKIESLTDKLEEQLEEGNTGTAKKLSASGFYYCGILEKLYGKFTLECDSLKDFLSSQTDQNIVNSSILVSKQVKDSQNNIRKAIKEHKELFYEIIHNF